MTRMFPPRRNTLFQRKRSSDSISGSKSSLPSGTSSVAVHRRSSAAIKQNYQFECLFPLRRSAVKGKGSSAASSTLRRSRRSVCFMTEYSSHAVSSPGSHFPSLSSLGHLPDDDNKNKTADWGILTSRPPSIVSSQASSLFTLSSQGSQASSQYSESCQSLFNATRMAVSSPGSRFPSLSSLGHLPDDDSKNKTADWGILTSRPPSFVSSQSSSLFTSSSQASQASSQSSESCQSLFNATRMLAAVQVHDQQQQTPSADRRTSALFEVSPAYLPFTLIDEHEAWGHFVDAPDLDVEERGIDF